MEKTLVKSGVSLIYLPISEVINRLNKVLGVENWSFEIISVRRDEVDTDEIIAHVSLSAEIDGKSIVKHGFGGQTVKRQRKDNKPVDLGNDFKGAVSDALKKAAQQLGIGLFCVIVLSSIYDFGLRTIMLVLSSPTSLKLSAFKPILLSSLILQ